MEAERWTKVRAHVERLADLSPVGRAAGLAELPLEMRRVVAELLLEDGACRALEELPRELRRVLPRRPRRRPAG